MSDGLNVPESGTITNPATLALLALLDKPIDQLAKAIADATPPLSRADLLILRECEERGKTRKGATAAINDAIAAMDKAAIEAERARIEALTAKFGLVAPAGGDAAAAAKTGPSCLVLGNGEREISGLNRIEAMPDHYTAAGPRVMYGRPIRIEGADIDTVIRSVALLDDEGEIHGVCEIPGGLPLGGRTVELPAGSLIFG